MGVFQTSETATPLAPSRKEKVKVKKGSKDSNEPEVDPAKDAFAVFDRSKLVSEVSMHLKKDKRGRELGGFEADKVYISKELATRYKKYLRDLFISFKKALKDPRTGAMPDTFDKTFLSSPAFQTELYLFSSITVTQEGDSKYELDEKKADEYLKNPRHIELIEEMMENHLRLRLFGSNLAMLANPGANKEMQDEVNIKLDVDRGVLNKFVKDKLWPWLVSNGLASGRSTHWVESRLTKIFANTALLPAFGLAFSRIGEIALPISLLDTTLMIPATAVGLGAAVVTLVFELAGNSAIKGGLKIDKKSCVEGLMLMQSADPNRKAEALFLKQVMGIDVDDFAVDASGNVTDKHIPPHTINRPQVLNDTLDLMYTRFQYHKELGVDMADIDAMFEQGLLENQNGPFSRIKRKKNKVQIIEQTRSRAKERIVDIYRQLGGSFDPYDANSAAGRDELKKRLGLMAEARLQYMREIIQEDVNAIDLKRMQEERKIMEDAVKVKLDARKEGGSKVVKKQEEIEAQKTSITSDRKVLSEDATKLKDLDDVDKPEKEKQEQIDSILTNLHINSAGIGKVASPTTLKSGSTDEVEISAIEILRRFTKEKITDAYPDCLYIGGVDIGKNSITQQIAEINDERQGKIKSEEVNVNNAQVKVDTQKGVVEGIKAKISAANAKISRATQMYDSEMRVLQSIRSAAGKSTAQEIASYRASIESQLKDLRDAITQSEDEVNNTLSSSLKSEENTLLSLNADLRQAEADAKEAKEKIKTEFDDKVKTQESRRSHLDSEMSRLATLIQERNDARKSASEKKKNDPAYVEAAEIQKCYVDDFAMITRFKDASSVSLISQADLESKSVEDIMKAINEAYKVMSKGRSRAQVNPTAWPESQNGVPERRTQVLRAIIEAKATGIRSRKTSNTPVTNEDRREAIATYNTDIGKKLIYFEADKQGVMKSFESERRDLEAVQTLLARQSKVLESNAESQYIARVVGVDGARFLGPMSRNPNATLSELENSGKTKYGDTAQGYFHLVDLLTGYMTDKDRNESFKKWRAIFTPDVMNQLVGKHFLGVSPNTMDLDATLNTLSSKMKNGIITESHIRSFVINVSREKLEETNRKIV